VRLRKMGNELQQAIEQEASGCTLLFVPSPVRRPGMLAQRGQVPMFAR
jgi:hypothetical protein